MNEQQLANIKSKEMWSKVGDDAQVIIDQATVIKANSISAEAGDISNPDMPPYSFSAVQNSLDIISDFHEEICHKMGCHLKNRGADKAAA